MKAKSYISKDEKIKTFQTKVAANSDRLHLNIKIVKGGKVVHEERGKSFVANFARLLGNMMSPPPIDESIPFPPEEIWYPARVNRDCFVRGMMIDQSTHTVGKTDNWPTYVFTATNMNGNVVTYSHDSGTATTNTNTRRGVRQVYITRGPYQGLYNVIGDTSNSWTLDGLNVDPEITDPEGLRLIPITYPNPQIGPSLWGGLAWGIGLGSGTTPTAIDDITLETPYYPAEMTAADPPSVAAPSIALGVSRISIATNYTNNSGEEKTISEIGLYLTAPVSGTSNLVSSSQWRVLGYDGLSNLPTSYAHSALVARDVITPFQIQASESFTVIYEIVTSVSGNKNIGILENFNEILYRRLANSSRAARNYFNEQIDSNREVFNFFIPQRDGGINAEGEIPSTQLSNSYDSGIIDLSYFGILLGNDEGSVDADDFFLRDNIDPPNDTKIPQGNDTGQLVYYPTKYVAFEMDSGSAYVVLERIVENLSGGPIEVKQVGLGVAGEFAITGPILISRINLDTDSFTIANSERYRIQYKIGVELGGGS